MPSVDFSDPMEVVLGPPEVGHVAELRQQLADAQSTRFGLDRQLSELCRHMGPDDVQPGSSSRSEKSDHMTFEQALAAHLDDTGDSAVPHVAATYKVGNDEAIEAKYLSLKTRFRKMEDSYRKELDSLHDEIAVLQDRMKKLDAARAQAQNNEATLAETLQKTTSQVSSELVELCCENHALSCENHELMRGLIDAKVRLAQCAEREIIWRREMYKARQTNKSLAEKMAKLEGLVLELGFMDKK